MMRKRKTKQRKMKMIVMKRTNKKMVLKRRKIDIYLHLTCLIRIITSMNPLNLLHVTLMTIFKVVLHISLNLNMLMT